MSACGSQPCKIVVNWVFVSPIDTPLTCVKLQHGTLLGKSVALFGSIQELLMGYDPKLLSKLT